MDEYRRHGQRWQPSHLMERGAYSSSRSHRYLEFPPRKGQTTSGRSTHSSYEVSTKESQTINSRFFEQSLSTDNNCLPFNPPQPTAPSLLGYESSQAFPYNRGMPPGICHLQGWNFWNMCYASQPQPEAWYPGLCSVRIHRNSRERLDMAQNAGRQEFWQSLTNISGDKSGTRWPAKCNNQLEIQPNNIDRFSRRSLATCRRHDDGIKSQLKTTVNVISDKQVKMFDGSLNKSAMTEILHAFIEKLSLFPVKENSVQTIENCITASRLPVKTSFVVDKTVLQNHKRPVFSGTLYINDIFIAHVSCYGKKLLKHKVYDAALHVLKNTSAQHLLAQNDLEQRLQHLPQETTLAVEKKSLEQADEEILLGNPGLKKNTKTKQVSKSQFTMSNCKQEESLNILIQDLKMSTKDGGSAVLTIDKKCIQLSMKLLTVYKIVPCPGQQTIITCDLYILDSLIAQGQGSTRKKAQSDAYLKGGEILKQSRGYEVLISFPKFSEEELSKPDIFDVVYKGYTKVYESNRCRLNRLKQLPEQKRKISELVIVEHEDWAADRRKHSHCILNQSATQCGCLLEWTIEPGNGCFRCTMWLQGEEISTVLARQRKTSLRMASSIALFKLYDTQPVIQGFHLDHPQVWISREKLVQHLESSPGPAEEPLDDQADGNKEVDKTTTRAIEEMLEQFFCWPTVEEFVAAPDWKLEERKLLRTIAISKGLRVLTDVYCDDRLPIISQKHDLSEMVNILEKQTNKCQGRYRLLPTEERPSYNDIAGEIAANESMIAQCQISEQDGYLTRLQSEVAEAEQENRPQNNTDDELSLFSEDGNAFITANSTFCYSATTDKLTVEKTPTQMISDIALPNKTSTPVRNAAYISNLLVDEYESPRRKHNAVCLSPTTVDCFNGECLELDLTSLEALGVASRRECDLTSSQPTSSLSTSVVHKQQMVSVNPIQAKLEEDYSQDATKGQWTQSQHRKFNESVDLEAGINVSNQVHPNKLQQTDQLFTQGQCMEQQLQWIEQEY